jgi:hypothetical protein
MSLLEVMTSSSVVVRLSDQASTRVDPTLAISSPLAKTDLFQILA